MRLGHVPDKERAMGKGLILGFVIATTALVTYQIASWTRERKLFEIYQAIKEDQEELNEEANPHA